MISKETDPVGWALLMYELADAREHLDTLMDEMTSDPDFCEEAFRISLGHICSHLNRAWHRRNIPKDFSCEVEWEKASQFPPDLEPI